MASPVETSMLLPEAKKEKQEKDMKTDLDITLETMKQHSDNKAWKSLMWLRFTMEAPFYFDLIVLVLVFYYADVALDCNAVRIFIENQQWKYCAINVGAIFVANAWTFYEMRGSVSTTETDWPAEFAVGGSILWAGYLIPSSLHIGYLVGVSLMIGRKHPLLLCAKLAEATLEASISSLVQVYALIYSSYDWGMWLQIAWSFVSSCLSIGYAYACFDRQGPGLGLNGIPGKLRGWSCSESSVFFLVYIFRCAEVSSRISSIAIFSVATRGYLHMPDWLPLPENVAMALNFCLITAGFGINTTNTYTESRPQSHIIQKVVFISFPSGPPSAAPSHCGGIQNC